MRLLRKSSLVDPESHTLVMQAKVDPELGLPPNVVVKVDLERMLIPDGALVVVPKSAVGVDEQGFYVLQEGEEGNYQKTYVEIGSTGKSEVQLITELDVTRRVLANLEDHAE